MKSILSHVGPARRRALLRPHGYICPENFTPTDFYMVLLQNEEIAPQLLSKWKEYLALNAIKMAGDQSPAIKHSAHEVSPVASASQRHHISSIASEQARTGHEQEMQERRDKITEEYKNAQEGGLLTVHRADTEEIATGDDLRFVLGPEPPLNVIL